MARVLAHHVRKDMAWLGACELLLSATLVHGMLLSAGATPYFLVALLTPSWNEIYLAASVAIPIVVMAATMGLYRPQVCQDPRQLLVTATIAGIVASPIVFWVTGTPLSAVDAEPMIWLSKLMGLWLLAVLASRLAFGFVLRHGLQPRRLLVLGSSGRTQRLRELLRCHRGAPFELVTAEPSPAVPDLDAMRADGIWGIVVAGGDPRPGPAGPLPNGTQDGGQSGIHMFSDATFQERHLGRIDPAASGADELLDEPWGKAPGAADVGRRCFDLIGGAALLLAALPLMVVVAILIKLDSPGPVFYRQQRAGLLGRPFMLLKFRSMRLDAETPGAPRWAQKHDPRITRIGHFMRQTRIDELPQLLNVLRGHMSVIGPRPERPHFIAELALAIPFYDKRAFVRPGITGWAQVNYPYGASVEDAREKLAYDLYYVKHRSMLLNIVILCSTVRVILFREGAR